MARRKISLKAIHYTMLVRVAVIGLFVVAAVLKWTAWSPAHFGLLAFALGAMLALIPALSKEKNIQARQLLTMLLAGSMLNVVFIAILPFLPRGPYEMIGFWGAGAVALSVVLVLLFAHRIIAGFGSAVGTTMAWS